MPESPLIEETSAPIEDTGGSKLKRLERQAKILADFRKRLRESATHRGDWINEAKSLYDLAAGRQWDEVDKKMLEEAKRPCVTFNVSGKYLDALTGLQINNRQDIRYAPREPGDARVNEILTGAVNWGRDLSGMADDETDSFYDCVLTGEGWMEGFINRDLDPSGVPCGERVDPLEMFPDPVSRKRNYEDARYLIRLKWISPEDYEELTKGVEGADTEDSADEGLAALLSDDGGERLQVIEVPHDYGSGSNNPGVKRLKPMADYQWWERVDSVRVDAPGLGTEVFEAKAWPAVKAKMDQQRQAYTAVPYQQRVYRRAIIAGGTVLKDGKSPYKDGFTFHSITGKRDRNTRTWYGIGRALIDPQKWVNKFFSSILFSLMSNAKGGIMAEEGAFVDQRKAEDTWASADSITMLKEGAIQKGKVQAKPEAPYPTGMQQLMEFTLNALPQTSGLNLELLGLADRQQAGVVEAQRKQSAMAIVAWAFDGMRRYYRAMGRMLAHYVKEYMDEGTLIQVTGEKGKQYVPLVKGQLDADFDVIVDEAPTSVNQQERVWAVLQSIIPQLLQANIPIPPKVLEYSPLPQDLKDEWQKVTAPDPEQEKAKQATMQGTVQKLMAEVKQITSSAALDDSNAQLNQAKAAQIMQEIKAGPKGQGDPREQMALEAWKAQMKASVDQSIAELRANKEQETKLLIAQTQADSAERMALLTAAIDARLKTMDLAQEDKQHEREQRTAKHIAQATADKAGEQIGGDVAKRLDKVTEQVGELVKEVRKPRKTKKRVIRDAAGDVQGMDITEST